MRIAGTLIFLSAWALGCVAMAGSSDPATETLAETVITADRLVFDQDESFALFEGNVRVTDPQMEMTCGRLTVRFDAESGQVSWIQAEEQVRIVQEDKKAMAGRATFDVESGAFVLEEQPRVLRGRDMLEGEVIRYWRGENRMVCEPQAKLTVFVKRGAVSDDDFFKE